MIQAIKELGELKLKKEGRDTSCLLSILVQDPNQDGKCPKALVAVFKKKDNGFEYSDMRIEDVSKSKIEKYLYCRGSSQGPDNTPTAKITEIEKFFKNKIKAWFKKHGNLDDSIIKPIKKAIEDFEGKIMGDLSDKLNGLRPKLRRNQVCLYTLAIEEENELKYMGDIPIFKNLLIDSVKQDYQRIRKSNHICSVCGEKKSKVYGEAIPIPFYTLDKPGYIAGGFQKKDAWKNAPLCLECSLKIEEGKKFLDTYLKKKIAGQQYYLIPKFIMKAEGIDEVVDTFYYCSTHSDELLREKTLKRITEDEKDILEELGKLKDVVTYNFLFFSSPNPQVFKINLLVEDVLPSRISTIFKAKEKAEQPDIFKNIKIKKDRYENIEFRYDELKKLIPSPDPPYPPKLFLEVVNKSFRGINLDLDLLFSWFMEAIRKGFIAELYLKPLVLRAFVSLLFFKNLGILPQREIIKEGGEFMTDLKEKAEDFFSNFSETFVTPIHKGVFLLGVLTQKLLNIQAQERQGATPFRKNLKSLKMNEDDFKSLLSKIQNKLEEYGKNYYRALEALISEYFIRAGRGWGVSIAELNFYFVLGMNLVEAVEKALGLSKEKEV